MLIRFKRIFIKKYIFGDNYCIMYIIVRRYINGKYIEEEEISKIVFSNPIIDKILHAVNERNKKTIENNLLIKTKVL